MTAMTSFSPRDLLHLNALCFHMLHQPLQALHILQPQVAVRRHLILLVVDPSLRMHKQHARCPEHERDLGRVKKIMAQFFFEVALGMAAVAVGELIMLRMRAELENEGEIGVLGDEHAGAGVDGE